MSYSLDENYWTSRYRQNQMGWDVGEATTPLKQYLDQISNRTLKILIPGAGNAYEAAYAYKLGFKNVHVLDLSPYPLKRFSEQYPQFPKKQLHQQDFFQHQGQYDLIIEQTFFCAISPELRDAYVSKMQELLVPGGKLVGVLFDVDFGKEHPPFGGDMEAYLACFSKGLKVKTMERCHNSIPPRLGAELFFIAVKEPQ
ncbi:methyltransferase domain-containing protein [Echinicola sediminis]